MKRSVLLHGVLLLAVPFWSCALGACGGESSGIPADAQLDSTDDERAGDLVPTPDSGGDVPGSDGVVGPRLSRLAASGKHIVDKAGNIVMLRGVNLGGWMFHETWITQVGFTTAGRVYQVAQEMDLVTEVKEAAAQVGYKYGEDAAVCFVCPGDGQEWAEEFAKALEARVGAEQAGEFMTRVGQLPIQCDDSDRKLRLTLADRFGTPKRDQVLDSFQRAWLTQNDIQWIAQQGFTVVRVPIGYRSLMIGTDADAPLTLEWNQAALDRLLELVSWCEANGIWAVIDIQEAPGGQNTYGSEAGLYTNPAMQELTIQLWEKLSDLLHDKDAVAAYSLLAEPYGAPTAEARDEMYDRLVKAIRAKGDDHLLVIHDGFRGMESLPKPSKFGWSNVVYSTHLFEWGATNLNAYTILKTIYDGSFTKAQDEQQVPYYIGSFSTLHDEEWAYQAARLMVDWFLDKGWSWSLWTYKRLEDQAALDLFGLKSAWGVRSAYLGSASHPDPDTDSFEALIESFAQYENISFEPNVRLLDALLGAKP